MRSIDSLSSFSVPSSNPALSRRRFLQASTAYAAFAALSGCTHQPAKQEGTQDVDRLAGLLAKEREHPFYADPGTWLHENPERLRAAFDVSGASVERVQEYCIDEGIVIPSVAGVRVRRTPGSNILVAEDEHLANIAEYIRRVAEEEHHGIAYEAFAHEGCGACKVYAKEEDLTGHADTHGIDEIEDRVEKLRKLGVNARYAGSVPMKQMQRPSDRHPAAAALIDCTAGRLHDHRRAGLPDSFVVSAHDVIEIKKAAEIILMIAASDGGYGKALDKFDVVVFHDKSHADLTDATYDALREIQNHVPLALRITDVDAPVA